ncbi:GrpB family protein [Terrilactibacillus sp. S3-3]|nr:GrpB family protein [Terrilactibacillus sp. S3-3]
MFEQGTQEVVRHLAFRDYLISHKEDAAFYSRLKEELAQSFPSDIDSYAAGKDAAVKRIEALALEWWYAS